MFTRTLRLATLAFAVAVAPTRADIMRWFWEVEVNGEAVDATQPIPVGVGDNLVIELWAEMIPGRWGFAESHFSLLADDSLFTQGVVNIDPADGYGVGHTLDDYVPGDGEIVDSDGNGISDTIDGIHALQMPIEIPPNNTDMSNPIQAYSLAWSVTASVDSRLEVIRQPTLRGEFVNAVYLDGWGARAEYISLDDTLCFVPSAGSVVPMLLSFVVAFRIRR